MKNYGDSFYFVFFFHIFCSTLFWGRRGDGSMYFARCFFPFTLSFIQCFLLARVYVPFFFLYIFIFFLAFNFQFSSLRSFPCFSSTGHLFLCFCSHSHLYYLYHFLSFDSFFFPLFPTDWLFSTGQKYSPIVVPWLLFMGPCATRIVSVRPTHEYQCVI